MPNWVTNKVKAPGRVIGAMLDDKGVVDFNRILPFQGEYPWNTVSCAAETLAETVIDKPVDENPLLGRLQRLNRAKTNIDSLDDESFEQFVQMLRNHRKCGFLRNMDFARQAWGTKWNAVQPVADIDAGTAKFDTAWSCPRLVFVALSRSFPDDTIEVQYADEDIGSNCGSFALKSGTYVTWDVAPQWRDQSEHERAKWTAFAYEVTGQTAAGDEE